VRRLRTWFEPGGFREVLATTAVAVLAASEPLTTAELVGRVEPLLGDRWAVNGRPMTTADLSSQLHEVSPELRALDLLGGDWQTWEAGPSARTLLPRATMLAHLLSGEPAW
jgi:hypothetical protein